MKITLALALSFSVCQSIAQKLPNAQTSSVWAPASIKIDGNSSEWPEGFNAHNSATDFFYTMANDDKYLYITIQERNRQIIYAVLNGGATVTIKSTGNKSDKGKSITYPVYNPDLPMYVNIVDKPKVIDSSKIELLKLDSFVRATNLRIGERLKTIKVDNIAGIDSTISVYNDEGIKVASLFDRNLFYTIEFALPLRYLNLSANTPYKFTYQIKINAVEEHGITITRSPNGIITSFAGSAGARAGQSSTYFGGEYTLAKKP